MSDHVVCHCNALLGSVVLCDRVVCGSSGGLSGEGNDGAFNWDKSFALSLTYDMEFSADELTDKTITEIDRLTDWSTPALAALRDKLSPCMATVGDGDRFTAVGVSPDKVVLFLNSREQCQLETLDLRRAFFQIWLSDNSQFPTESRRLKGVGN